MFRRMARKKIDEISHHFLEHIDLYMPADTKEKEVRGDIHRDKINRKALSKDFKFGIFGNTLKGMRPYTSEFDKVGIVADIPRNFYTTPSIVRALWLSYDDFSD